MLSLTNYADWCQYPKRPMMPIGVKNREQKIPYISDKEASIDSKPSLTIALLSNYYLVIECMSRENEERNSIKSEGAILQQSAPNSQLQISALALVRGRTLLCRKATRKFVSSFGYVIDFI